jgi:hypothetical protein
LRKAIQDRLYDYWAVSLSAFWYEDQLTLVDPKWYDVPTNFVGSAPQREFPSILNAMLEYEIRYLLKEGPGEGQQIFAAR